MIQGGRPNIKPRKAGESIKQERMPWCEEETRSRACSRYGVKKVRTLLPRTRRLNCREVAYGWTNRICDRLEGGR